MDKIFEFTKRITSDTFLKELPEGSIRNEILSGLLESYTHRVKRNITQKEFSGSKKIPLATLKRIELGKCYNIVAIIKYCEL